jgi:apolipoprotein N-acyltransferase
VALAPLLVALDRQTPGRGFLLGLTAGIVYFSGTLYWISHVMVLYGGLHEGVAILVNAALVAYLALFPAVFALVMASLTRSGGASWLMAAPFAWVATELGRTYLFTGFPWVLLGYSQVSVIPVAQLASVASVYGVSALVVAVSAGLAILASRDPHGWRSSMPLVGALVATAAIAVWGAVRVSRGALLTAGEAIRVGLVQGNIEQGDKWNPNRAREILERYLHMSRETIEQGAQLVVWPEASMPTMYGEDQAATARIRALAVASNVPLLIGSDQVERGQMSRYYNSAVLVRADGSTGGVYHKMHLVPFGEYVPAKNFFFFASRLVEAVSDFSAGRSATLLPVGDRPVSVGICYEIVYPDLVRQFVAAGSELLTTITNDAWFGVTSAPHQHFAQAAMRAIENGRYLVRAANTGVSGIVDPYGRVTARSGLFVPATLVGDVRFLRLSTVYTRSGNLFAYFCVAATIGLLVAAARAR